MAFKFRIRNPKSSIDLPSFPVLSDSEEEGLTGMVQGMQASAPEERLARALTKLKITFVFRYTVGAPRGLPGWKELDFLIQNGGIIYAYEVDTAFTHREKAFADVLHDSIILNDPEINAMGTLYPKVFHADGELDLADQKAADKYAKKQFGIGLPPFVALPEFADNTPAEVVLAEVPQVQMETAKVAETPFQKKTDSEKKVSEKKRREFKKKQQENEIKAILNNKKPAPPKTNKR